MFRITVDILDPHALGPIAAKETIAMALERFGPVRVVRVQDSEDRSKPLPCGGEQAMDQLKF